MLTVPEDFPLLYAAIKADTHASEDRKVSIFVSALEADSICALRILQSILTNDGVHHSVFPVTCYSQVINIFEQQINIDEVVKNVFLINLGVCEDATQMLYVNQTTRLIIIDSRRPNRPINHNLIHTSALQAVVLCDKDDVHMAGSQAIPPPDGVSEEEPSDDEDLGTEGATHSNKEDVGQTRRRASPSADDLESRHARRRKRRREIRQRRKEYYEVGFFWGQPSALVILKLAQLLHQGDKHNYWLAAISLTDHLIHQRISLEKYTALVSMLELEIQSSANPEDERDVEIEVDNPDGPSSTITTKNPTTSITADKDFIFALVRHWTLYDSMFYSPLVAARLETWCESGRRRLDEFFTRLGLRLEQCKAEFSEMKLPAYKTLENKLDSYSHIINLAADAVHAVSALLGGHDLSESDEKEEGEPDSHTQAFWRGWHALNPGNKHEIMLGLDLAKNLQKAILTDGGLIISRRDLRSNSKHFCWVDLTKTDIVNKKILSQPSALLKLGVFLRDHRVRRLDVFL